MDPATCKPLWFEALEGKQSWTQLWSGYIRCGECLGIRRAPVPCVVCGAPPYGFDLVTIRDEQGNEHLVPPSFQGAEGRFEDWVYLRLMEREWKRSLPDEDESSIDAGVSPRASIVILFWTYFETRLERILRAGLGGAPERVLADTFDRYANIGSRLTTLYKIAFGPGTSYQGDLESLGYGKVWQHLANVRDRRNRFAHGEPTAIDDALVHAVVEHLKIEHEAWIAVFNKRATKRTN